MTRKETIKKWIYYWMIVIYCTGGYLIINHFNNGRAYYDVSLPLDHALPFLPYFVLGYTFYFLSMIMLCALVRDWKVFVRSGWLFILVATVHFIIFVLFPVRMDIRPALDMNMFWDRVVAVYYSADNPYNCLPSMHVSLPILATMLLWNYRRGWGIFMLFSTIIIAASVILVKQHYIMDIVASFVVTASVMWVYDRVTKKIKTGSPLSTA